nr:MAG TPA: hypothetical protein [Caudoviricetes sp.]
MDRLGLRGALGGYHTGYNNLHSLSVNDHSILCRL